MVKKLKTAQAISTTNNYGRIIIALYDVYDSNNYWLRTQGMKYTTSEPTILGETTINSEKWVFTGYLQYENGTALLTSGSMTNSAREKSLQSAARHIMGEGWSLDIPYLEVNGENVYVTLPNGQTYEADFSKITTANDEDEWIITEYE
ncbi:hypothetical protein [Desulfosporosinus meridiei]|uniref:Uncharacterized protein n=1 Tax=Desulfosporosinus meridiei (strain ATCC BAA-275 / DSM 13257 / KCTC 12902 / NCIMB 13706 / S10) TaxID=768704 RepID=J7IQ00_DESMD|nr:hypothetical protein [Desulfosporosinus meridiei]AFQ43922.1 hypothetical protein Desmer_1972 [Desulfosporosinus meridiei DSM 13257]